MVSRSLITVGGIGTIVAVSGVFLYLLWVVLPLLFGATVAEPKRQQSPWSAEQPVVLRLDEYRTMGWALFDDGRLRVFRMADGQTVNTLQIFEGKKLTAVSKTVGQSDIALGFGDGSVQFGTIEFKPEFFERPDVPADVRDLAPGQATTWNDGVVQRTPQGQFRLQKVAIEFGKPMEVAESPVVLLDHVVKKKDQSETKIFAFSTADGKLAYAEVVEKEDFATFEVTTTADQTPIEITRKSAGPPAHLLISGLGDNVFLAWSDGQLVRYDTRNLENVLVAETEDLLENAEPGARVTVLEFILGRETLLCGDSQGRLTTWFRIRDASTGTTDQYDLQRVRELAPGTSAVAALGSSERGRMVAVGYADGLVRVFQVTTNQLLGEIAPVDEGPVLQVAIAPKDDGLMAATPTEFWYSDFEPKHPEVTLSSLFLPVWYEGYREPVHLWQSSFAGVGPEMKLGLWPLIHGTLKATFYSMLFGAPLAILAAIFTSEFLPPRWRSAIKPTIEMMASLPSVVLGFLAALVFAPIVARMLPSTLAAFVTFPVAVLGGAYLWQLLPQRLLVRLERYRLLFVVLTLPVGFVAAAAAGPWIERALFAGNVTRWLDGQVGTGTGAWMFLFVPLAAALTWLMLATYVNPWIRRNVTRGRNEVAVLNLVKFLAACALTLGVAWIAAWLLDSAGWDPRGSYVGTYVQRNALVVGFVMGFAIIPIIYTIADDALSAVPQHLRSASLAAGATPWQTTVRIVLPTAMSGLFSAVMIGLGRAVGETMIVLMAGGNTPVTEWNVFNGFRTLSANIAVELPEAVRDSTHYRTLFLAALTLFVLTFVVNTVAEVVRQRFRRRAYQL